MTFRTRLVAALTAVGALLSACSPSATLDALTARDTYEGADGVAYGPLPRQRLDLFRPRTPAPAGGYPVVVFFYGGSWNHGERAGYRFVGEALASRGVLTLVADYRLYPQVRYPDFLRDGAAAVAYALREAPRHGGNPDRVFVMGHSAGGYNAAMLALDGRWLREQGRSPRELAGWIGLAGAYDFFPTGVKEVQPVFGHPDYPRDAVAVDHVRPGGPPAWLAAPRQDALVDPQRNTAQMVQRLRQAGVPVTGKVYERVNHATLIGALARPLRWLAPVLDDVVDFVDQVPARPPG
jgi:acetyl esterase/lipase